MKNLLIILLLSPLTLLASPDFSAIAKAINEGNIERLSGYFDQNIEVTLMDDNGLYNKEEASRIIKSFFKESPARSFKLVHQGSNNKGLHYCIGDLVTAQGAYRVCYYLKEVDGSFVIQEFGIEEE